MPFGEAFIVKTGEAWLKQAEAGAEVTKKYGDKPLRDVFKVATKDEYKALCGMIEAFIALGVTVSDEIKQLAEIRTVNEVLGLPMVDWNEEVD